MYLYHVTGQRTCVFSKKIVKTFAGYVGYVEVGKKSGDCSALGEYISKTRRDESLRATPPGKAENCLLFHIINKHPCLTKINNSQSPPVARRDKKLSINNMYSCFSKLSRINGGTHCHISLFIAQHHYVGT